MLSSTMAQTVRFTEVMKTGGHPEIYLPLADPKRDKSFQKAAEEKRVVSLKQKPTGVQKDYGVVGVLHEKYVTYLIFPKSLERFENRRIVGIKYEELDAAETVTSSPKGGLWKNKKKTTQPKA